MSKYALRFEKTDEPNGYYAHMGPDEVGEILRIQEADAGVNPQGHRWSASIGTHHLGNFTRLGEAKDAIWGWVLMTVAATIENLSPTVGID